MAYSSSMENSIKQLVAELASQMKPKVDLLDPENQNTLIRAMWMHHGSRIKASTILRGAQKLR